MFIVHVAVHVRPENIAAFKDATLENARNSIQEHGIARFDFMQQQDDPTRFLLVRSIEHRMTRSAIRKRRTIRNGAIPWPK